MDEPERTCALCQRTVAEDELMYVLKLQLFAEARMPEISEEDLERDVMSEIEALLEQMKEADAQELEDEVFEQYTFMVCSSCRQELHQRLKPYKSP